ncbi:MAG: hypothetical protein GEV05_15640 [Betaproteobacteria bacterium]|nr:hypothetical protein [Betaproteobacteria bacterium]
MSSSAGRFSNLIVASTCYHVILACLIARDARFAGPSLLVVNARREQMAALCEPLAQAADSPFAATMPLPEVDGRKPARERALGRWLAQLDDRVRVERVFVFTDLTPELQLLCRRARARGALTFCAEDGGAAYSSQSAAAPWRLHWQRVVRFGPWIQNVTASGSSRHVQTCLALHATLVRPELQRKPVWSLQPTALPDLLASSWIGRFLAHYGVSHDALVCDELYAPARTRTAQARERLRGGLREEIRAARQAGRDCIVKYHPREREDFLGAAALGARLLPAAIPAELVYLASGARLSRVIGDAGTTLLTARWLVPHAHAFSALELAGRGDDAWYVRTLDRLGVQRLS